MNDAPTTPRRRLWRRLLVAGLALAAIGTGVLAVRTRAALRPFPERLPPVLDAVGEPRFTDRDGRLLSITYQNDWNVHDRVAYHEIPELLRDAFVIAEDQRFFRHHGVDWPARVRAVFQNVTSLEAVSGASTITEQVVRMLHPRPRTLWSKWLEGFEAARLEERFSKAEILEFYLNQVPYARQRRGVAQAARGYFDRDLETLSPTEMLALAVLVRSPSRLDLERGTDAIRPPIERLARSLHEEGLLPDPELAAILAAQIDVHPLTLDVDAAHFVRFAAGQLPATTSARPIRTTLDASLQERARRILDRQVEALRERGAFQGAVLVIDHRNDEILAWVNSGGFGDPEGGQIDKVLTPRQPGSTLKPFVYAMALERGWTAATLVEDAPLAEPVGHGLHQFRNYSRTYYGPLRVREALANSLNTPAVRAAQHVGRAELLERLRDLGFTTLTEHPDFYGDGLALGTGEVSLYALVRAYATLARGGLWRPLHWRLDEPAVGAESRRLFDPETASVIADILSDADARSLEFGRNSLLQLPVPTAVKTGTSNDYRDAWTVGFDSHWVAGVWMGDLDRRPMEAVTGSVGPALVLRGVFAELHRHGATEPLFLSRRLVRRTICRKSGRLAGPDCPTAEEWFRDDAVPTEPCPLHVTAGVLVAAAPRAPAAGARLVSPTPGLHMALDPRIPDELEAFPFQVEAADVERVEWIVDDRVVASTREATYLWSVARGHHLVQARVWQRHREHPDETQVVGFLVK